MKSSRGISAEDVDKIEKGVCSGDLGETVLERHMVLDEILRRGTLLWRDKTKIKHIYANRFDPVSN